MGKKPRERVHLGDEQSLTHNPFAALAGKAPSSSVRGTTVGTGQAGAVISAGGEAAGSNRVEVRREKKGRGGKVVTLVSWLAGAPPEPISDFAKAMARALGTGARVEGARIVIQGDLTQRAAELLAKTPGTSIVLATQ